MGVLSGKDIYSPKWITADITDASGLVHYVPIKYTIGDYFITELEGQVYAFKIQGSRIKTWRKTMAKSFRKLYYDTSHYLPISAQDTRELAVVLEKNNLPRINGMLFNILKLLSHREKQGKEFAPHDLKKLAEELAQHEDKYSEQVLNIKNFLTHLDTSKIVTPVRKITEFIEDDLMATDPKFLGSIISSYQRTDLELKKVTNTAIDSKGAWMKILLIIMVIGLVGGIGYYMYDSGILEDFGLESMFGDISVGQSESDKLMQQYTPVEMKLAVERGDLVYSELPKDIRDMVDQVELPEETFVAPDVPTLPPDPNLRPTGSP